MKLSTSSAALASAALLPVTALAQMTTSQCSSVHVFLAKGNNEPYPGRMGKLIAAVCAGIEGCDYEDIQWQNMLEDEYCGAVMEGVTNGMAQIQAYNRRCPDTKLVLSGYSQGGQVIGDILGGGGGVFFQDCVQKPNAPLPRSSPAGKMIVAAMIFGDTRHVKGQSYNYLSGSNRDGIFPRPANQLAAMNDYASVLRNWCVETDPICAQGNIVDTHLNYFDIYSGEAAAWVKAMVEKATVGGQTTAASTSSVEPASKSEAPSSSAPKQTTTTTATTEVETKSETASAVESAKTEDSKGVSTRTQSQNSQSTGSKAATTSVVPTTSNAGAAGATISSASAAATTDKVGSAGSLAPSLGLMALVLTAMLAL